jgi:serine/threonine-protein kinase
MVDQRGLVYLLDLGIAMKEGERQPDFASDGYMAPELWRGEPAEPSADVYSLGVTFFEMATGERYPSVNGSARSVQGSTDPNLGQARQALMARLPQQIAAIIARALQDDPRQRYPGMAELLANLAPHRKGADLSRLLTWWIQPGQPVPAAAAPRSGGAGPSGPPVAPSGPGDAGQSTAGQAVCPSCERPLRDTARFCDACGQPITGAQPAVPAIPAVSAIPAVPATVACPACGHENRAGARFCNMCRQQL